MSDGIRISTNNFKYAEPQKRVLAWLIDFALVNLILLLLVPGFWVDWSTFIGSLLAGTADFMKMIFSMSFVVFWIAPLVYLSVMGGFMSKTVGMIIVKIRIANLNGSRIGWVKAILRSVLFVIASIPFGLGFLPILFNAKKQGLHDKLSETVVILKR